MNALLLILCCAQGDEKIRLEGIERRDGRFRVTLGGSYAAEDGAMLRVRILPRVHLSADGVVLTPAVRDTDGVICRAAVRKNSFAVSFTTGRLIEHLVQVARVDGRGTPLEETVQLLDSTFARGRLREEKAQFEKRAEEARALIGELEPWRDSPNKVPAKIRARLNDVVRRAGLWAQETALLSTGVAMTGILADIDAVVPFENSLEGDGSGYAQRPEKRTTAYDPAVWIRRLEAAEALSAREMQLLVVHPARVAGKKGGIGALRELREQLGVLGKAGEELAAAIRACEDALIARDEAKTSAARELLNDLRFRLLQGGKS